MNPYATHFPVLLACLRYTSGPVLELGGGWFSTPLLAAFSIDRLVVTIESDSDWHSRLVAFCSGMPFSAKHRILHVGDYAEAPIDEQHWSVVLLDHAPAERRGVDLLRLQGQADLLVLHDSEAPIYGYEEGCSRFKYRYDYKELSPWTSVVSDVHPLDWLPAMIGGVSMTSPGGTPC